MQKQTLTKAQFPMDLSPYNKQNFPQIWPKYAISSETMRLNIKVSIWHVIWCKLVLIWLILVESTTKNGISSSNDQDAWQKTHICSNLQCDSFLHFPSCSITCWKYTFCSIPILLPLQTATYLELQLINFNWVGPLSLAQLYPSLSSIFMPKTGIIQF